MSGDGVENICAVVVMLLKWCEFVRNSRFCNSKINSLCFIILELECGGILYFDHTKFAIILYMICDII